MKFKEIIGGYTEKEAITKFPWLEKATFTDAVIDITEKWLVWKDGIWKDGIWENGIWKDGIWKDGIWKDGIWEDGIWEDGIWEEGCWKDGVWEGGTWGNGTWEGGFWGGGYWGGGKMWSNISQQHEEVVYKYGKFSIKEPNKK